MRALPLVAGRRCRSAADYSPTAVVGVYRRANAANVIRILDTAMPAVVKLWALDSIEPRLARSTLGTGPGPRSTLLNRLVASLSDEFAGVVVILDDDVAFTTGTLECAVHVAREAGFGLAQPAHDAASFRSHPLTEARPLCIARTTTFVEIGPVVIVAPEWRHRIFPIPHPDGMGIGLDAEWSELSDEGCRLGIIDAIRVRHLVPPGSAYDMTGELASFRRTVDTKGGYDQALRTVSTWWCWQRRPPWQRRVPPTSI